MEKQGGVQEMTARTLRALYGARRLINRDFRQQKENKQLFIQISAAKEWRATCLAANESV